MAVKLLLIVSLVIALSLSEQQLDKKRVVVQQNVKDPAKPVAGEKEMRPLLRYRRDAAVEEETSVDQEGKGRQYDGAYTYPEKALQQKVVRQLFSHLRKDRMFEFVKKFSSFPSRHMNTQGDDQSEAWLTREVKAILDDYKGGYYYDRSIKDSRTGSNAYKQGNIIAHLAGQDPTFKGNHVILGAHYDTNGSVASAKRPGADDNASGCAVLMEVLRIIVQFGIKFKHTVEFHFYTASEGRRGSTDVVAKYKSEKNKKVIGMLNLDTLGYQPMDGRNMGFVNHFSWDGATVASPELTYFVKILAKEYLEHKLMEVDCTDPKRCVSDHVAWNKEKHPWAFVTEAVQSPNRNSELDTIETVNFDQVNEFAKLALAVLIELGDLAEIPNIPEVVATTTTPSSFAVKSDMGTICFYIGLLIGLY